MPVYDVIRIVLAWYFFNFSVFFPDRITYIFYFSLCTVLVKYIISFILLLKKFEHAYYRISTGFIHSVRFRRYVVLHFFFLLATSKSQRQFSYFYKLLKENNHFFFFLFHRLLVREAKSTVFPEATRLLKKKNSKNEREKSYYIYMCVYDSDYWIYIFILLLPNTNSFSHVNESSCVLLK